VRVPAALSVCGHFWEGRSLVAERARKARVAVNVGDIELPHAPGTYAVPALFGVGELGPAHAPITPAAATARYQVIEHPNQIVERIYTQAYATPDGPIELRWQFYLQAAGLGFRFEEPYVTDFFDAILGDPAAASGDQLTLLGSCQPDSLEPWRLRGDLADGGRFQLDFRHRQPQAGSGPLFPTRGEVTLDGQTVVVDDYFRVIYAGEHHNWNNNYWILFAAPITYRGHAVHGVWIDQTATGAELEVATTLDAAQQPLDTLAVTRYVVERAP
jgi:hypothetical protein